ASIARETPISISGDRRDRPAGHPSDSMVTRVGDVEIASRIYGHSLGEVEGCAGSTPAVARESVSSISCERRDRRAGHFPNPKVVGDVEVASQIQGHSLGYVECCAGGGPSVTR